MGTLKKNLERREKSEVTAIITHMLRQEPELQWLPATPLPTASSHKARHRLMRSTLPDQGRRNLYLCTFFL
jgi:hypothetical protein